MLQSVPSMALRPGRLVEVREASRRRSAGVDHQEVEAAQRGHGPGHGGGRPVRCREVRGDRRSVEAGRLLREARALAGDEGDRDTLGSQRTGDRAAEAAAAPADERAMSGQAEVHTRLMVPARPTHPSAPRARRPARSA